MNNTSKFPKEVGDRAGEGKSYCYLGCVYYKLIHFQKAIDYHQRDLNISKEVGDRRGEGIASYKPGNTYHSLGDFQKAVEDHEQHLKISKKVEDRGGERKAYDNLSCA